MRTGSLATAPRARAHAAILRAATHAAILRSGAFAAAAVAFIVACGASTSRAPDAGDQGDGAPGALDARTADAAAAGASLGSFELTYYWVTAESDFSGADDTAIYDSACDVIANVPSAFADALDVEGTGRLTGGTVINDAGACSCPRSPCYEPVDAQHPWGYGVENRALVPFRTVAVDPNVIPYGTGLYLAEFDGVTMPGDAPWGGFVHDGCVVAGDTGGGIIGMHVDFFSGLEAAYQTLDAQLGLTQVTVYDGGARCPSM